MWTEKYIGIPFQYKGRDLDGIDCWGLVRLVYSQEYNIELPTFVSEYEADDTARMEDLIAQYREGWEQVESPIPGSVVVFRILGRESHVGIVVDSETFLHAKDGHSSTIERFGSTQWKNRVVGYFKYSEKKSAILNVVPHPLRTIRHTVPVPAGTTLDQLANWVTKEWGIAPELKPKITILVNGVIIEQQNWATTILSDTDAVEYRAVPEGGGVGRMLAMLAIAVIAPYAAASLMTGTLVTSAAALTATGLVGTIGFAAVTMGVSLVGSMLVNAIAPIRPPAQPADPGSSERQLMITGGANRSTPYGAIPVVLGKVKLTPPLGANNYITYANERDTYLAMLLVWGYGPLQIYQDTLKIGNVAISDYIISDIVTLDRKSNESAGLVSAFNAIYGSDVDPRQVNLVLVCDGNPEGTQADTGQVDGDGNIIYTNVSPTPGPYKEVASSNTCNSVEIALHFPQGLRKIKIKDDGAGNSYATTVQLRLEVKIDNGPWVLWKTLVVGGDGAKKDAFTVVESYTVDNKLLQVRVRRETGDNTEDNPSWRYNHEVVFLSATFTTNQRPAVDPKNSKIAKTALKIKANDQLNSQIEGINAVVETYAPSWNGSIWIEAPTNNPADLFRYVLQHPANPQRVLDADVVEKINLTQLQYWHSYCVTKGFTYNSILGQQRSILDVLRDICAAGRASPAMIDGKWTVIIDEPRTTIVQHFTPHNSWGFEGTRVLPKLPDGLRITYYDEDQDYQEAEIIVYRSGKDQSNSELFESISLPGVTKKSAVIDHARWNMAQAQLRREIYTLNADLEYLVCNRGDRVKVMHDAPLWGLGSGRIKNRISNTILELDEPVQVEYNKDYSIRFRGASGISTVRTIKRTFAISSSVRENNVVTINLAAQHPFNVGDRVVVASNKPTINATVQITEVTSNSFKYRLPGTDVLIAATTGNVLLADSVINKVELTASVTTAEASAGDLFLFGLFERESQDLIVLSVEPSSSKSARITLIDYGVTDTYNIFTDYLTLTSATVFETDITLPPSSLISSYGPDEMPIITNIQSDDAVAEILSPGTYAYRIRVSYANLQQLPIGVSSVEYQYDLTKAITDVNLRGGLVDYNSNTVSIPNVLVGEKYRIRLRYVSSDGRTGPWTTWTQHTVVGKVNNYGEVDTVVVRRVGRYLEITPDISPVPTDFKHFEVRVFKNAGTGDFWDISTTTQDLLVSTTTSVARFDLKDFSIHRISPDGVKYRVACRAVDSVGNYSSISALTSILLETISP